MERKTQIIRDANDSGRGPGPDVMASSTLEGTDVYNQAEQKLGTIQDIMIDIERGHVAYAVLSHGGVLGIGEKLFAIPWSALTLDTQRECFVLDIDLQRFKLAAADGGKANLVEQGSRIAHRQPQLGQVAMARATTSSWQKVPHDKSP